MYGHTVYGFKDFRVKDLVFYYFASLSTLSILDSGTWVKGEVAQSCPTLCDPVDCSLPGSCVHGILQARILEWVAISFSRGSCRPRDRTQVSRIGHRCFNLWATREVPWYVGVPPNCSILKRNLIIFLWGSALDYFLPKTLNKAFQGNLWFVYLLAQALRVFCLVSVVIRKRKWL